MNTEKSLQFFLHYDVERIRAAHKESKHVSQLLRALRKDEEGTLKEYASEIDSSIEQRAEKKLKDNLDILTSLVQTASETAKSTNSIPIVLCGEDFFQGGDIATDKEIVNNTGTCIPRDMAFKFFAKELRELSEKYPEVIILPGSAYLSVKSLDADKAFYDQDNQRNIKPSIYVQNVMPVFYNGEWVKLIKKGSPLVANNKKILTESAFLEASSMVQRLVVKDYGEDNLTDINRNLVVFGDTPLPNEEALLQQLNIVDEKNKDNFFDPIFQLDNLVFGIEICRDHRQKKLAVNHADDYEHIQVHAISALGVDWEYNAGQLNQGYRVQADSDSRNCISVTVTKEQPYELNLVGNILISAPLPYPSLAKKSTFEPVESKESSKLERDQQPATHATSYSCSFFKSATTKKNAVQQTEDNREGFTSTSSIVGLNKTN